jgi:16S rRNA (cytosine967-C5)-methyltransferase
LRHPPYRGAFDRVLVDAPCSNLGVLRRRPEARWNLSPEKISALASRQSGLLAQAAPLTAPGGRLVYAVCSAESEETWDVVQGFLHSSAGAGFSLAEAGSEIPSALIKQGCLWIYPGETEYDGFFAAALNRKGAKA